jgi:hypothetical protein
VLVPAAWRTLGEAKRWTTSAGPRPSLALPSRTRARGVRSWPAAARSPAWRPTTARSPAHVLVLRRSMAARGAR